MDKKVNSDPGKPDSAFTRSSNGLLVFASRGRVITSEMVKQAEEDMFEEEIDQVLMLGGLSSKKARPAEWNS